MYRFHRLERDMVCFTLSACLFWTLLSSAPMACAEVKLTRVAKRIFVLEQPFEKRFSDSNSVVIVGPEYVVVVDAQANASTVSALIAHIARRFNKPVRYLINTHWHGDHTQGNDLYRDAYGPDLEIIGHATHPEDIEQRAKPDLKEHMKVLIQVVGEADRLLRSGRNTDGTPMSTEEKLHYQEQIDTAKAKLRRDGSQKWEMPTTLIDQRTKLELAGKVIEIFPFRAHTRGDLVLFFPEEKVLVSGDVLDDLPYCGHGYPSSWITALEEMENLPFKTLVPGHGSIRKGKKHLTTVREMMQYMLTQVRTRVENGASSEKIQQDIDLSEFRRRLTRQDDLASSVWDDFIPPFIQRAFLEATGEKMD